MAKKALWIVLVLGAAVRVAALLFAQHAPDFDAPTLDALYHHLLARGWALGDWSIPLDVADPQFQSRAFARPPGPPLVLAAIYRVFGPGPWAPRLVQAAVGLVTAWLAGRLSARLFPSLDGVAPLTAAMVLLCPATIYFELELVATAWAGLLFLLVLDRLVAHHHRPRLRTAAAAGLWLGVAALFRTNVLLFAPVALVLVVLQVAARFTEDLGDAVGRRRAQGVAALALTLSVLVPIAPVTARNFAVSGEWVLVATNGPITFLHGNHAGADGIKASVPATPTFAAVTTVSPFTMPMVEEVLGRAQGTTLTPGQARAIFTRAAWRWIAAHPADFAILTAKRLLLFFGPVEIGNNQEVALEIDANPALRWLPVRFWMIAALACSGLFRAVSRRRRVGWAFGSARLVPTVFAVTYVLSVSLFVVAARLRAPLLPVLAVGAAAYVATMRKTRATPRDLLLPAAFLGLFAINWLGVKPDAGQFHYERGRAWLRRQDLPAALAEFRQATTHAPSDNSTAPYCPRATAS